MRLRALLPSLFCLTVCTTDAKSEEVLFQVRIPDGAAMQAKSQQGLWKQMLDMPSMQAFQAWSLRQSGIEVAEDADAWDASPFPQDLDLAILHAAPGAVPQVIARADYGDQAEAAETMFTAMLHQFTEQGMNVPGTLRRQGTHLNFDNGGPFAWPEAPRTGTADIVAVLHTDAMARAFGQFGRRIQHAFALGAWRGEFRITPEAYHEVAELTARWPTLAPLDMEQMRGLPRAALFGGAIGIDGFALEEWALAVAGDLPEFTLGLATLDERCEEQGLPPFTDALFGLNGTAWLAVLPGAPFPTVTLAIPAGTGVDAFVDALGAQAQVDLAAARTAAVMLPVPPRMPIPIMVRRNATHWLLSTDMLGIEDFAARTGDAFDESGIAALAAGTAPVGLLWSDNRLTFQQIAGFMGLAQAAMQQGPAEIQEQFQLTTAMIRDMAAIVPPSLGVFTADATTLRMRGENMVFNMGLWGGIGAGMTIPAILSVRQKAQDVRSQNNMRQIVTAMVAWSMDHDEIFPPSFEVLQRDTGIPDAAFRSPDQGDRPEPHYLYIRPHAEMASWQPVLCEDRSHREPGSILVARADGIIRKFSGADGVAILAEAQRLAADPKAAVDGITPADWAAVEALLNR